MGSNNSFVNPFVGLALEGLSTLKKIIESILWKIYFVVENMF